MPTRTRTLPNIIITGTPCVGKTTTCTQLISLASEASPHPARLQHLCINQLVKERGCHEGWDGERQSWVVDEERLVGEVEGMMLRGGQSNSHAGGTGEEEIGGWLIDWHACDLFPREWVDLVVVLRCERTEVMWERLRGRNYAEAKLQENLDAEIFGVLLEEAREAFDEEMVVELKSETVEDVEENCERILKWIQTWREDQKKRKEKLVNDEG